MSVLKSICEFIGALVVTALMIAIPILTACSFFYGWWETIQYWLTMLTVFEWLGLLIFYENGSKLQDRK